MLEVSVVGENIAECLRKTLGELQYRTLGFWSKAMPSVAENSILFEKQPRHYWTLVNVEQPNMTLCHLVAEMPIMSWVLTDPWSTKLRRPSKNIRWKCYIWNQIQTAKKGTKYMSRWPQFPPFPQIQTVAPVFLPQLTPVALWGLW